MQRACPKQDHLGSPITFICTNPNCHNNRFLCLTCLTMFHQNCLNHILDIHIIPGKNLFHNINWIGDPDIKQAVLSLEKSDSLRSADLLLHIYKDKIEKEYDKLSEYFQQKIQEAKENRIKNFEESFPQNFRPDQFTAQLNMLYDFDSLIKIIDAWQANTKGDDRASKELDALFKGISSNQNELQTLQELANNINFVNNTMLNCDTAPFEQFRKSLDQLFNTLETANTLPKNDMVRWEWDPFNKSERIILSEHGRKAHKESTIKTFSGVLGNIKMSEGRFRWEIETAGTTDQNGAAFGIFEINLVKNLEPINWTEGIWQSTNSNTRNLTKVTGLSDYKNRTYVCDLNFNNDIFTVSHEGTVISEKRGGIKGHTFAPFALLSYDQNAVRIRRLGNQ